MSIFDIRRIEPLDIIHYIVFHRGIVVNSDLVKQFDPYLCKDVELSQVNRNILRSLLRRLCIVKEIGNQKCFVLRDTFQGLSPDRILESLDKEKDESSSLSRSRVTIYEPSTKDEKPYFVGPPPPKARPLSIGSFPVKEVKDRIVAVGESESVEKRRSVDLETSLSRMRQVFRENAESQERLLLFTDKKKRWLVNSALNKTDVMLRLLGEEPSLIHAKDPLSGYSALHWAAKHGNTVLLPEIASRVSDIDSRTHGGHTPLILSAMNHRIHAYKMLLEKFNANPDIRDNSGHKAIFYFKITDKPKKIQKFREVVMTFLFHPELKIRHLAAYALCTLTTDEDIPSLTHSLIEKVPQVPHANALHGTLYALNLIAPKDSTLLDNLELYLQDIPVALSCPIILTEVLRLLNVPKDSLIKELLQIKAQKFPHPGKALYERALIQKSLSFIRDSKDHDLASFLIEECQSLYFEVLNETKMSDLGGFALGLNESNMAQRICSLEDLHEFSIVLKLFVSGAELDSGCRFIWERLTFFFLGSPRESTYGKTSSSLTCIAIRAMTKYVNSFSPSHSDLVAWSNFLRRLACSPEESIRREIMDSISESSSYLSQLRDPKEAVVSLSLWFTLMTFSFEEDYPIKCSLLRILKHLRGTTPIQGPLLPNLIHVELCKWLIEHSTLFLAETRSVLLEAYDEIMNRNSPDGMETEASSLAFEKGDESIRFGELQAVQKLIEDHYKSSLNQGINDFKLQGFYSMKKMA